MGHGFCSFESVNTFSLMGKLTDTRSGVTAFLLQKKGVFTIGERTTTKLEMLGAQAAGLVFPVFSP
jgi:hypothetical protein